MGIRKLSRTGRRRVAQRQLALLLLAVGLAGCQSGGNTYYVSPRLVGRVLNAETHQPLAGVNVRRLVPNYDPAMDHPVKGGEIVQLNRGGWTDDDGRFEVASEKNVGLLSHAGWWAVNFLYKKSGFQTLQTEYTLAQSTNSASGEPVVNAGDVLLHPAAP